MGESPRFKEESMAKKRGQNEGSIYKRKNGLWVGQITIGAKREYMYFKTQREVREWLKLKQSQIDAGVDLAKADTTIAEYLKEWLSTKAMEIRPKTHDQYLGVVARHINPIIGQVKLKDLRPDQIQVLYNRKLREGASPRTVKIIHSVLHCAFNHAVKMGLIGRNPADAVTKPRLRRKEMRVLDDNQARAFLIHASKSRNSALYHLAVTTGLRQAELFGLKWSDLDWETMRLQVQRQIQRVRGGGLIFTEPKTAKGRRVVVLGQSTKAVLQEHFKRQQLERQFAGDKWVETDLIFTSTIGTPIDHRNLFREFKDLLKEAGLPNIRFHDLRHTAATLMLQQNIHPKVVQERLGHSDISLTLNTYSHVLPGMQEEAAEKMDTLLTPIEISTELGEVKERAGNLKNE
jgi:integrase